ncbi:MAG: protein-L-isoaspartate(D-aspartate) O-methyltransferase [bacterium]|nr:protein-L-isoaspartate(D-aspartate) O-methyltransferase [bacterium]
MVRYQLEARGITDPRVLDAMRKVPRHLFVPPERVHDAYSDHALPIGEGQTISQPYMVALMTQLLQPAPSHRVLEIGTGSGYQAAILAALADEVVTVEREEVLSQRAQEVLRSLGYRNITFVVGDGSEGYPPLAPYDGIIVTAGAPFVPTPLVDQLAPGGRLVIPVGHRYEQVLTVVYKDEQGRIHISEHGYCVFVPLIGKHGWRSEIDGEWEPEGIV